MVALMFDKQNYWGGYPVNSNCVPSPRPCMDADSHKHENKCDPPNCKARFECSVGKKWTPPKKRRLVSHEEVKAELLSNPETKREYDALEGRYQEQRAQIAADIASGERYPSGGKRHCKGKQAKHVSIYRGVFYDETRDTWRTCIADHDGKRISVGTFPYTPEGEEDAGKAVNAKYKALDRPAWMFNSVREDES